MNDSISINSSSFSSNSSNNSNSNSLKRGMVNQAAVFNSSINTSIASSTTSSGGVGSVSFRQSRFAAVDDYLALPMTPVRRRAKSQIVFYGDEVNTASEHNKQLIEDLYLLKKQLKEKDMTILKLNDIRDKLESEIHELSASLFEVLMTHF